MAKYTTELRHLEDQGFDFGLLDYPIFDDSYRQVLNNKILAHYRYCEIGSETPGRFKHHLNTLMDEIMPYYNKLYKSELIEFNPLYNVDYEETGTKTTTGESDANVIRNSSATNDNTQTRNLSDVVEAQGTRNNTQTRNLSDVVEAQGTRNNTQTLDTSTNTSETDDLLNVESDTPGGMLSIGDIKTNTWASKANRQDNTRTQETTNTGTIVDDETTSNDETRTTTGTVVDDETTSNDETRTTTGTVVDDGESTLSETGNTTTTINNLDDYVKRVVGNTGSKNYAEMLLDFRATFLNIDLMIIKELKQLFMGVY